MTSFTSVTGAWDDQPLYIIGGGPSLKGFDFDRIKDKGRLLGVNDSAFIAPCDALFSLDQTWHKRRKSKIEQFQGEKWFAASPSWDLRSEGIEGVNYLVRRRATEITNDKRDINGVNSGYGALHLAYHKRAKEIYLLGFDMKDDIIERDGQRPSHTTHWYKSYEWHAKEAHARFGKIAESFENTVYPFESYGATIINACPDSMIKAFPKCSLDSL